MCKLINPKKTIKLTVPGSKSLTNRALLLATLGEGETILNGVLFSDDSRHFIQCVKELGFPTQVDENEKTVKVTGFGGNIPKEEASLYVGSAGTAARFLSAFLGVCPGIWHMDASPQMKKRPMAPLLNSLRKLGCLVECKEEPEHFPFTLKGTGFAADSLTVDIEHSSQFLSALLIASVLSPKDMHLLIEGSHGMSYIEITRIMMEQFGVQAIYDPRKREYRIPSGQKIRSLNYQIEPDVSAAAYFYALGALVGQTVLVNHIHFSSMQGDIAFLRVLERMGCQLTDTPQGILLTPPADGRLKGLTVDMSACSDQAITLAAIAPFADSPVTITGIGHIRFQECDRLNAIVTELTRMGIRTDHTDSSITVYPGTPNPATIHTYEDHRMAMGFSLTGCKAPGIVIDDPGCCKKTFENYFEVLNTCLEAISAPLQA